jgi:hypothetical protein
VIFKREPALVVAMVQSLIAAAVSFGLDLSAGQVGALVAVTAAALGVVTRTKVSPAAPAGAPSLTGPTQ